MLYNLKLYSAVSQLYLTKTGRKKKVVIIKKFLKKERRSLSIYNGIQFIEKIRKSCHLQKYR